MDPRLSRYYNLELQHLREGGAEFAAQFPKVAARLGMHGLEVADPYVERLLEGVAFLAARVHLKLDAEFPRFTQALLEIVYPHYLAPTPAMLVAQLTPDLKDPGVASGPTVPRGSTLSTSGLSDDGTACEFRTAHDVRLWPIEIVSASYFSFAPDLPLNALPFGNRRMPAIKGGVRLRLRSTAGVNFSQLPLDQLVVYLSGREDVANRLYELMLASGLGTLVVSSPKGQPRHQLLPAASIRPVGFRDQEALLPVTLRSFQGYRLLQEYFAFPQRYRFIALAGLANALRTVASHDVELVVLLGRGESDLEGVVDAANFSLFCTPALNLFHKRTDRIHVNDGSHEYHVVPDRTTPLDFEVYSVTSVVGHGVGSDSERPFLPFYAAYSRDDDQRQSAYFTTRREPRRPSESVKRRGHRSAYVGTEMFLGLVDAAQAPFSGDLRQLSVEALCTNRDLPLRMTLAAGGSHLSLDVAAPIASIRVVSGPSRPYAPLADGMMAWRAISHLSTNYLSFSPLWDGQAWQKAAPNDAAAVLRDLLELYVDAEDRSARRQIEGIRSVDVDRIVRRLPGAGPLAFGRGLEVSVHLDELAFEGASAFLMGAVLNHHFARHVSINSFVETVLKSDAREISRWEPQWGAKPTL